MAVPNLGRHQPSTPPIGPVATQFRVKGIKTNGVPLVAFTFYTAQGMQVFFFEPDMAAKMAQGIQKEAREAPMLPDMADDPNTVVPDNN